MLVWIVKYSYEDYDGHQTDVLIFSTEDKAKEWAIKTLTKFQYYEIKSYLVDAEGYA